MFKIGAIYWFALTGIISSYLTEVQTRSFIINHTANAFYMDGKPFRFISGSLHYFRIPRPYWKDRIRKMKAAGLDTVSTYVEWSLHEPKSGVFDFSGQNDIRAFIQLIVEEEMYVILRPGPYICAERDMGGLPYWLLKYPHIYLRTADPNFLKHSKIWLDRFFEEISDLMYGNGGPIILFQIENEFGSYEGCHKDYYRAIRDMFHENMGDKAITFTCDGEDPHYMVCGKVEGVYATVDFGPNTDIVLAFQTQRVYEPTGPLVNPEYYSGWLTHWGQKLPTHNETQLIDTLKKSLDLNASMNFFVFCSGTNFNFTGGLNVYNTKYLPCLTNYFYNAPITDAGDLTPLYFKIKEALKDYKTSSKDYEFEAVVEKGEYGDIKLKAFAKFLSPRFKKYFSDKTGFSEIPLSFEVFDQRAGYLLYETKIPFDRKDTILHVPKSCDVGNVYLNGIFKGNISRQNRVTDVRLGDVKKGDLLSIPVENLGRMAYSFYLNDTKGILSPVYLKTERIYGWNMTSFEFENISKLEPCIREGCLDGGGYTLYTATFKVPKKYHKGEYPMDSYLNVTHLNKGVIFVNGYNLGRYWSTRGPQYSIYVPGCYLKGNNEDNRIIAMDEFISEDSINMKFITSPIFHN